MTDTRTAAISKLKAALGPKGWSEDADIIAPHVHDWRDREGHTPILLMPKDTQQVSEIMKICHAHGVAVTPQGGNTGLVGGGLPQGEVLLSLKRMNKIRRVNATENAIIAEAGMTVLEVQKAAEAVGRKFAISLASEGTCTVGGILSTNAGGVHVIKHGTTKEQVFGVEAVLADGRIHHGLTSLRKDNTGYDLSRLFLGAEGTLGIITAASLKLVARPHAVSRTLMGISSVADALALLDLAQDFTSGAVGMFEIMPRAGLELVTKHIPNHRDPMAEAHPWYGLMDLEFERGSDPKATTTDFLELAFDKGLVRDAVLAESDTQAQELLSLREHMSEALKPAGGCIKHDITVPLSRLPEFFERADAAVEEMIPGCLIVGFGHLGDGNVHYDVCQPPGADKAQFLARWDEMNHRVHDIVMDLGGSISAEHGIGTIKRDELAERADPVKMQLLRAIKQTLDPKGILNPRVLVAAKP